MKCGKFTGLTGWLNLRTEIKKGILERDILNTAEESPLLSSNIEKQYTVKTIIVRLMIIIFWMMIHILLSHCSMIVLKIAFYPRYYFLDYLMNILQVQLKCYPK